MVNKEKLKYNRTNQKGRNLKYNVSLSEWKQRYINHLQDLGGLEQSTLDNYLNILFKLSKIENNCLGENKTIEDNLTYDNLLIIIMSFAPSSVQVAQIYLSVIGDFLKFCIVKGKLSVASEEILTLINKKDPFMFVNKSKYESKYINEFDLYTSIVSLENPIDQALIALIFEGIRGKENIDITNILQNDFDVNNNILKYKTESGKEKIIKLNQDLHNILTLAISQKDYKNFCNLKNEKNPEKISTSTQFINSPYLFKPTVLHTNKIVVDQNGDFKVEGAVIQRRVLDCLRKYLNHSFITVNSLYISGIINRAVKYTLKYNNDESYRLSKAEFINYIFEFEEGNSIATAYRLHKIYLNFFDYFKEGILYN